jgi:hypothetical protein
VIRKVLAEQVSVTSDTAKIAAAILEKLNANTEWGLKFENVEVRGLFDAAENVPAKIRAYDPPHPDFEGPGHDLAADYWTEHLTPPYFQKVTYGSKKTVVTPTAPSLEWNVPSPPDFHHFVMQPKVAVAPEEEDLAKLGVKH